MAFEPITRVALGQPRDQLIPGLLGQHAGSGDGQVVTVTSHQGALGAGPQPQGQVAIDDHQPGLPGSTLQGTQHRQFGGPADAPTVNFGR
jgi:hypothetical protein